MIARDPVRITAIGCAVLAAGALALAPFVSVPVAAGLSAGLLLGSLNHVLARRALGSALNFGASSVLRLGLISILAVGLGLLLGVPWAPLAGVAAAQVVLAAASTWMSFQR